MYHNQGYAFWIQEVEECERDEAELQKLRDKWNNYDFEGWRRSRPRRPKKRHLYPPLQDDRTDEEMLEDVNSKERISHRKGWGTVHQQTRQRYWRPANNNWKRHRTTRYHI